MTENLRSGSISICLTEGVKKGYQMKLQRKFASVTCSVLAIMLLSGSVFAQSDSGVVPDNATANRFASGWSCDFGFQELDDRCVRMEVPDNATP